MESGAIVKELNSLVKTCKDSEYGFQSCGERVISRALRDLFICRSADCRKSAAELQHVVWELGGVPEEGGSALGTAKREWISLRSALFDYDDAAMLDECHKGEEAAMARYRGLLSDALPPEVRDVVLRQYEGIRRHHEHLCILRRRLLDA